MALNSDSKYPSRRAYVLKMCGNAKPDALAGRLENLVTGRQREFASSVDRFDLYLIEEKSYFILTKFCYFSKALNLK